MLTLTVWKRLSLMGVVGGLLVGGQAEAVTTANRPALVQVFIPGVVEPGAQDSLLTVKVKGLESPGRFLLTGICQVRYTVFDRQGRALMMYPNQQTFCADVGLSVNTARGTWQTFKSPLSPIREAGLPPGKYLLLVQIVLIDTASGRALDLPAIVSNTANLWVR
ncbi:hypothetical protein GO986_11485 [Deinococcus sp. HMF7620]|uniref:Intracellular proteinase inhibitor BsuPI domain-containing protein n=1 Tax=Deinococcus arboris TaxID=2682977 RepID=A0A7C9HYQ3_9DEIO|nr:hypothetical protein [Deinococcus arboris]MVN87390.1 hypothetical protein [Deinococcus arboris]